jgi:hypothetical protein
MASGMRQAARIKSLALATLLSCVLPGCVHDTANC